jgi:hypothetical protein
MQWVGSVARLFVNIQGRMVQIDLLPKGAEGFLVPNDLRAAVETVAITATTQCQFLRIGPLVACKIKAHYGRESDDDYHDLMFVCTSSSYARLVRNAANTFRREWKECFLQRVIEQDPDSERQVRWALRMERSPSPPPPGPSGSGGNGGGSKNDGGSKNGGGKNGGGKNGGGSKDGGSKKGGSKDGGGKNGGGKNGGGKNSGGGSAGGNSPRDGDKSPDGYWTFSAKYGRWYHYTIEGNIQWA